MKIKVFTVNFNNYDKFNDIDFSREGVEFYYLTDKKVQVKGFLMTHVDYKEHHKDPSKASRSIKCSSQELFDTDYSIYVDASFKIKDVDFKKEIEDLGDFDIAQFKHPERNCLYDEAEACIENSKFESEIPSIINKVSEYSNNKFPANYGLACGGFIIRKHSQKMIDFDKMWWNEIKTGTGRDQISEMYCIWKTGIKMKYIKGDIYNNKLIKYNNG